MLFGYFSNLNINVKVVEKVQDQYFNVILQSRGQDPQKSENYETLMSPTFNKNQDLVP